MALTTLDIEIALMLHFGVRQNIIVHNVSWGLGIHEMDLCILTKSNYATEIEIKISKADLLKDKLKKHGHRSNHVKYFYFAVPEHLRDIALEEIPERAGLFILFRDERSGKVWVKQEKTPVVNKQCLKWTADMRMKLAELGTMRILTLKKVIQKNTYKVYK